MYYSAYIVSHLFKIVTGIEIDLKDLRKDTDEFFGKIVKSKGENY